MRPPPMSPLFPYTTLFRSLMQLKEVIGTIRKLQDFDIPQPPDDVVMLIAATTPPPNASDAQEAVEPEHPQPERQNKKPRSEEHTSELQSLRHLVCRLLLEK